MMSQVTFYKDLGFDRAHANVRDFATPAARDAWFASHADSPFPQVCNYNKVQNSFDLEIQYDDAIRYGYCKVSYLDGTGNPTGFSDYCFIDSVQLINDRVCRFELTVDPWQTYMFKPDGTPGFTLERSFVVRAHVDRWGSRSTPEMQIYPNEGIDGFAVVSTADEIGYDGNGDPSEGDASFVWFFMAYTTGEAGNRRIAYALAPLRAGASSDKVYYGSLTGKAFPSLSEITSGKFLSDAGIDPSAIQCASIIPFVGARIEASSSQAGVITSVTFGGFAFDQVTYGDNGLYLTIDYPTNITSSGVENPCDAIPITVDRPVKPTVPSSNDWDDLDEDMQYEPVMFMSPVRRTWLYDGGGTPLLQIPDDVILRGNGDVTLYCYFLPGASGAEDRFAFETSPDYPARGTLPEADALGRVASMSDSKVDMASDAWLSYVVTQRDTVMRLQALNTEKLVVSGVGGAIGNILSGDVGGLVSDVFSTGYSALNMDRERRINEQGIKNQTSGVLSQGSATGLMYVQSQSPVIVRVKADDTTMDMFFDKIRYEGYNVRRYMTPNLRSRRVFNHIATMGAVVRGDMPEDIRSQLQDIFDGGVTIWHDSYDYDSNVANIERSLTG